MISSAQGTFASLRNWSRFPKLTGFVATPFLLLAWAKSAFTRVPCPSVCSFLIRQKSGNLSGMLTKATKYFTTRKVWLRLIRVTNNSHKPKKQIERTNMKSTSTSNANNPKTGLGALLTPENSALILIDHQPFQFSGLRSHDTQTIINNVVGLAKSAKFFGVPTLLTTVIEKQGGYILKPLQDVFPEQKPINRTFINTWEDAR